MIAHLLIAPIRRFINWLYGPSRDYEAEIAAYTVEIEKAKRQKKKHSHLVEQREAIRSEQLAEELGRDLSRTDFARF